MYKNEQILKHPFWVRKIVLRNFYIIDDEYVRVWRYRINERCSECNHLHQLFTWSRHLPIGSRRVWGSLLILVYPRIFTSQLLLDVNKGTQQVHYSYLRDPNDKLVVSGSHRGWREQLAHHSFRNQRKASYVQAIILHHPSPDEMEEGTILCRV